MLGPMSFLAWLEPDTVLPIRSRAACVVELASKSDQRRLAGALERMGVKSVFARSEDDARAGVDDLREVCSACEDGRGKHRCASCQSAIFVASASASLDHRKEPSR
jgi:hypothetical protein